MKKKRKVLGCFDPILRKKAKDVYPGKETNLLIEEMKKVLKEERGVGLAAPQIGESKRVVIVDTGEDFFVLLNPEIIKKSKETVTTKEGCLSVRGVWLEVVRAKRIKVKALTREGKEVEIEAEDLIAVILQHEIDHLQGRLFIDNETFVVRMKILLSYFFKEYLGFKKNEV